MKTISFEYVKQRITLFSDTVFGKNRPFTAPLHHLKKEVDEAIESGELEEFVDMQLLILDAFRMKYPDLSTEYLLRACDKKIDKLYKRKWGVPDKNGVVEHIRKGDEN